MGRVGSTMGSSSQGKGKTISSRSTVRKTLPFSFRSFSYHSAKSSFSFVWVLVASFVCFLFGTLKYFSFARPPLPFRNFLVFPFFLCIGSCLCSLVLVAYALVCIHANEFSVFLCVRFVLLALYCSSTRSVILCS